MRSFVKDKMKSGVEKVKKPFREIRDSRAERRLPNWSMVLWKKTPVSKRQRPTDAKKRRQPACERRPSCGTQRSRKNGRARQSTSLFRYRPEVSKRSYQHLARASSHAHKLPLIRTRSLTITSCMPDNEPLIESRGDLTTLVHSNHRAFYSTTYLRQCSNRNLKSLTPTPSVRRHRRSQRRSSQGPSRT